MKPTRRLHIIGRCQKYCKEPIPLIMVKKSDMCYKCVYFNEKVTDEIL